MKKIILFALLLTIIFSCKKEKDDEKPDLISRLYDNANGWEIVASEKLFDQNNLIFFNLEYAKMHGDVLDAVITWKYDGFFNEVPYRWQFNSSTESQIRKVEGINWFKNTIDYSNNNEFSKKPYHALSKGLGDDDLIFFSAGGIYSVGGGISMPNRYNYPANYIINLGGENPFVVSKSVQSNYKVDDFARIFNYDGYDIYFEGNVNHVAAGLNANGRLVTAGFSTAVSIYNEPFLSVYESTINLGNYPLIGDDDVAHPTVVRKSYKLSDFEGGIPSGSISSTQQIKDNIVTFIISNENQSCMMKLDVNNFTITKVGDIPKPNTENTYLVENKENHFFDMFSREYWDGNSKTIVENPDYKTGSFLQSMYFNGSTLWHLVTNEVDGIKYLYILKKNL